MAPDLIAIRYWCLPQFHFPLKPAKPYIAVTKSRAINSRKGPKLLENAIFVASDVRMLPDSDSPDVKRRHFVSSDLRNVTRHFVPPSRIELFDFFSTCFRGVFLFQAFFFSIHQINYSKSPKITWFSLESQGARNHDMPVWVRKYEVPAFWGRGRGCALDLIPNLFGVLRISRKSEPA